MTFEFDVFISYSKKDLRRVRRIARRLRDDGLRVWFDDFLPGGSNILVEIERGLVSSRCQALFLSPNSVGSEWVTFEHTAHRFRDPNNRGRTFLPVLLQECAIPEVLRGLKVIDYRKRLAYSELREACLQAGGPALVEARVVTSPGQATRTKPAPGGLQPPRARILLVDNNPDFVDPLRDRLILEGWHAEVARTQADALGKVRDHRYHFCVLDKRLADDHDEEDRSGIELLPNLWRIDGLLQFVVLTGFAEAREVVELMRKGKPFPGKESRCVGYLDKKKLEIDGIAAELANIKRERLKLNWQLDLGSQLSVESALGPLFRAISLPKQQPEGAKLFEEAELLLRWIFYSPEKYPNLRFQALESHGRSGAQVFRVSADGSHGWILKLATRLAIEEEWENYLEDVSGVITHYGEVVEQMCQVGKYLGAIAYGKIAVVHTDQQLRDLRQYVADDSVAGASAEKAVKAVVEVASPWAGRERSTSLRNLTAWLAADAKKWATLLPGIVMPEAEEALTSGEYGERRDVAEDRLEAQIERLTIVRESLLYSTAHEILLRNLENTGSPVLSARLKRLAELKQQLADLRGRQTAS